MATRIKNPSSKNHAWRARRRVTLPDGSKLNFSAYGSTKREAEANLDAKISAKLKALQPTLDMPDVDGLFLQLMQEKRTKGIKPRTIEIQLGIYKLHIRPYIGSKSLPELSYAQLVSIQQPLIQASKTRTAQQVTILLGELYRYGIKLFRQQIAEGRLVLLNLANDLPRPKDKQTTEFIRWTDDERNKFLSIASDSYYNRGGLHYPLFVFLLATGCRIGEALGVEWDNVTPNYIRVIQQLDIHSKDVKFSSPKTRAGKRKIPISLDVYELLKNHKERLAALYPPKTKNKHNLVFTSSTATPLSYSNIRRALKAYCTAAKVPSHRLHDFRREWFTTVTEQSMAKGNYNPKTLMALIGHEGGDVALKTYTALNSEALDTAVIDFELDNFYQDMSEK